MISRPKLFSEFLKCIRIVNRPGGGIKIICMKKEFVMLECKTKPWNSPDMRRTFLANLYIKEILMRVNMSKRIQRPAGFELLGKRAFFNDEVVVIVNAVDVVDKDTGEMSKKLTIAGRWASPVPTKVMINQVQL